MTAWLANIFDSHVITTMKNYNPTGDPRIAKKEMSSIHLISHEHNPSSNELSHLF
jgi:hypothetical protein